MKVKMGAMLLKRPENFIAISGILAVSTGLIYVVNLYGLTFDATPTTTLWGKISMLTGIIAIWINGQ